MQKYQPLQSVTNPSHSIPAIQAGRDRAECSLEQELVSGRELHREMDFLQSFWTQAYWRGCEKTPLLGQVARLYPSFQRLFSHHI